MHVCINICRLLKWHYNIYFISWYLICNILFNKHPATVFFFFLYTEQIFLNGMEYSQHISAYSSSKKNFCTAVSVSQHLKHLLAERMLVLNLEFNFVTYFHMFYIFGLFVLTSECYTYDVFFLSIMLRWCSTYYLLLITYYFLYLVTQQFQCCFIHMLYKYIFCQDCDISRATWFFLLYIQCKHMASDVNNQE